MFVAINYISCTEDYAERFEQLMSTRVKQVDTMPGFKSMEVLKPDNSTDEYLIISRWEDESDFKTWTKSNAFQEGHKRGFEDIKVARQEGRTSPMKSSFKTYRILSQ
jgi:heme oxygenase (mycobilin-producing)